MKDPNIVHIAQDDKFINAAVYLFQKAFPDANTFIIVKSPADRPLQFVNSSNSTNFRIEICSSNIINKLKQHCLPADVVVLHGMDKIKSALVLNSTDKKKFMGIVYGAELYNKDISGNNFYGKKTARLHDQLQKPTTIEFLKDLYRSIRYKKINDELNDINIPKAISEIQVFGTYSKMSHNKWVSMGIMDPEHRIIPFSYYPLEYIIDDRSLRVSGDDILLGNSASLTNNHLEAFDMLKELDLGERKVITPLSYGSDRYARLIIKKGNEVLNGCFEPIIDYMPVEEYNKLLRRCGIVVMNHYRSQAVGNLITVLYLGSKVFMNDTSAYRYFKNIGCEIYLIQENLLNGDTDTLKLLNEGRMKKNREILRSHFSTEVLVQQLREGINENF